MRQLLAATAVLWVLCVAGCDKDGEPPSYPNKAFTVARTATRVAEREALRTTFPAVDAHVAQVIAQQRIPSLALGLLADGHVLWWRTYGTRDLERGGAVTPETVYRIGSITKVLTGMALLKLRDEGQLSLDTAAQEFIPEMARVRYPTPDGAPISLRHLLTHTSGLPNSGTFDYGRPRERGVTEAEVLASLDGLRLEQVPGVENNYSNLGYALLSIIVARVSGVPYRQYVTQHLLMPLGMRSAVWDADVVPPERLATGYVFDGDYRPRHHWRMGAAEGMGGLYASLDDMVRFTAYHMSAWPPGGRPELPPLNSSSLRESHLLGSFQRPGRPGNGIAWRTSYLTDLRQVVSHMGATHQYAAAVAFLPDDNVGVVVLSNCGQHNNTVEKLASDVLRMLVHKLAPSRPYAGPASARLRLQPIPAAPPPNTPAAP